MKGPFYMYYFEWTALSPPLCSLPTKDAFITNLGVIFYVNAVVNTLNEYYWYMYSDFSLWTPTASRGDAPGAPVTQLLKECSASGRCVLKKCNFKWIFFFERVGDWGLILEAQLPSSCHFPHTFFFQMYTKAQSHSRSNNMLCVQRAGRTAALRCVALLQHCVQ